MMPVTVKLSRNFYDRFGDELVDELVEWFNLLDATYKSELRDINEANFGRLDAKLEQRTAQLEAKIDQRTAQLDAKIDQRTTQLHAKIDQRTAQLDAKIDQRTAQLDARIETRTTELRAEMRMGLSRLETAIADTRADMIKWSFVFWAGSVAANFFLARALLDR